jgi:hypothetical protein
MSVYAGPELVNSELVLSLDAGNSRSYPGTGTTWTDLSSGGYNATMYGNVPFSTDIAPCFDFSGATGATSGAASLGFTFASNMITTTGDYSICCWVKGISTNYGQSGLFSNAGSSDGFRYGVNNNNLYFLSGYGATYNEGSVNFLSTLSSSLWYNVVGVYSRSTGQILAYVNGVYQGVGSIPTGGSAFTSTAPGLVRSPCCSVVTHKIGHFSTYNKALSAAEIRQNFNALRGRFGI